MSELHDSLSCIQKKLKAPKGQFNSFGKYNYRSCEDILEAVKPLLANLVMTIVDDIILIGDRYYVRATVSLTDGTVTTSTTAWAREEETKKGMDASQITGAASSYARKYALNGMFLIDDTKDADTKDNTSVAPEIKSPKKAVSVSHKANSEDDVPEFKPLTEAEVMMELKDKLAKKMDAAGVKDKKEFAAFILPKAYGVDSLQVFIDNFDDRLKLFKESKGVA